MRADEAQAELAQRKLARRHFGDFCRYVVPQYPGARHLGVLCEALEGVERYVASGGAEGIGRLMVFMPPRYWKSTTCSVLFPQWFLGRNPDLRVILASYAASLATGFSRKVRNGIQGLAYGALFGQRGTVDGAPREVASDSRAADEWELAAPHRGGMTAAGVGGGLTGKGAHLLIVDDPIKDRREADSDAVRNALWDWWTSTAFTRLEDGAAVLIVLTRWHDDDLAGRLLRQMLEGGEFAQEWRVLTLAARAEIFTEAERKAEPWLPAEDPLGRSEGAPLWPEKHDDGDLKMLEAAVGPYDWASLFQQRPYSRAGGMFKEEWFRVVPAAEAEIVQRVRCWDKAGSDADGAYTAGVLMGRTATGRLVVEHVCRGQWSTFQREEKMLEMARLDLGRPGARTVVHHPQDPGSAGLDSARATNAKLAAAGIEAHFEPVTGSKEVRAGPWSSACEAGIVDLVDGPWVLAFVNEHLAFPRGRFKDQVDAAADCYAQVGILGPAVGLHEVPQDRKRVNRWDVVGHGQDGHGQAVPLRWGVRV